MRLILFLVTVMLLVLAGCNGVAVAPVPANSTPQGVFVGTASNGSATLQFLTIVQPGGAFSTVYETYDAVANIDYLDGLMTGQGATSGNSYTVQSLSDYSYTGTLVTGSLAATFVPNQSLNGTVTEAGSAIPFSSTMVPLSSFNFNQPAKLSDLAAKWTGVSLTPTFTNVMTIDATGSMSGSWDASTGGCSYVGKFTPDAAHNFFTAVVSFAAIRTPDDCPVTGKVATGVAVIRPRNGITELVVGFSTGSYANVFVGDK